MQRFLLYGAISIVKLHLHFWHISPNHKHWYLIYHISIMIVNLSGHTLVSKFLYALVYSDQ